jgi:hypothetical protein
MLLLSLTDRLQGITAGSSSLVNEGLEGHHMVLIMAVLITCPHITQLRLDGNKVSHVPLSALRDTHGCGAGLPRSTAPGKLQLASPSP